MALVKVMIRQMFDQVAASWMLQPVQLVDHCRPVIGNAVVLHAVPLLSGIQKQITRAFVRGYGEAYRAWIDDVNTIDSVLERAMRVAYAHQVCSTTLH